MQALNEEAWVVAGAEVAGPLAAPGAGEPVLPEPEDELGGFAQPARASTTAADAAAVTNKEPLCAKNFVTPPPPRTQDLPGRAEARGEIW